MEKEFVTVKDMPVSERPYDKCLRYGPETLSDAELLAVILRTGKKGMTSVELARKILSHNNMGLSGLSRINLNEYLKFEGVGVVKAMQLLCIGELSKRIASLRAALKLDFCDHETVADYYMETLRHEANERLIAVFLDTKHKRIGEKLISIGTINCAMIPPREILIEALKAEAVYLVILHNHPSGDPTPSEGDINATKRLARAGEIVGIKLYDHIIIGDNCHVSLKLMGII